jgi:hypothetical protein
MPDRTPDPDFAAAANVLRGLFLTSADVEHQLTEALARIRASGGSGVPLAVALLEVMGVVHEWNLRPGDDPAINCHEAAGAILDAIERGLAGP